MPNGGGSVADYASHNAHFALKVVERLEQRVKDLEERVRKLENDKVQEQSS